MTIALENMQAATRKARLPEPEDEVWEALVASGEVVFMPPGEEDEARVAVLLTVVKCPCKQEWSWHLLEDRLVMESKLNECIIEGC